jgi:glycosyltransferase involved in cell wall biosynthesis
MISVIIPTIYAREQAGWLDRCITAYENTTSQNWELIVVRDKPACGIAWNEGIAKAKGDYIHLSADDLEPLTCWDKPAVQSADRGELPSARILNTDGTLQSCGTDDQEHEDGEEAFVARIPFGTREQFDLIGPMLENQYMGDYWFSHRGRQVGLKSVVRRNYTFFHHYAQEGRIDTLSADVREYHRRGGA